jgi:hypothetical protein
MRMTGDRARSLTLLRDALQLLQSRDIGAKPTEDRARSGTLEVRATVSAEPGGTLRLGCAVVTLGAVPPHDLAGATIGVRIGPSRFCLGVLDRANACEIPGVLAGGWWFTVDDRPGTAVPLPLPDPEHSFAADHDASEGELLRAVTPGRRTLLVLRRTAVGEHRLEIGSGAAADWRIVAVRYSRTDRHEAARIVPFPPSPILSSAILRLDDFDVRGAWEVQEDLPPDDLARVPPRQLADSVAAALSSGTRRAWSRLLPRLSEEQRHEVERELEGGRP